MFRVLCLELLLSAVTILSLEVVMKSLFISVFEVTVIVAVFRKSIRDIECNKKKTEFLLYRHSCKIMLFCNILYRHITRLSFHFLFYCKCISNCT